MHRVHQPLVPGVEVVVISTTDSATWSGYSHGRHAGRACQKGISAPPHSGASSTRRAHRRPRTAVVCEQVLRAHGVEDDHLAPHQRLQLLEDRPGPRLRGQFRIRAQVDHGAHNTHLGHSQRNAAHGTSPSQRRGFGALPTIRPSAYRQRARPRSSIPSVADHAIGHRPRGQVIETRATCAGRGRRSRRPGPRRPPSASPARGPRTSRVARLLSNHGPCVTSHRYGALGTLSVRLTRSCSGRARPLPRKAWAMRTWRGSGLRIGEQTACRIVLLPAPELVLADLGDVGVVHVAGQEGDRAGRLARARRAPPARPCRAPRRSPSWKAAQCSRSRARRIFSPHLATRGPQAPVGHRLVDRLEVVDALRDEERQRRADEQVVDVAAQLAVEPGHLVVVEDRALVRLQHPGRPRVHHHEPWTRPGRGRSSTGRSRAGGRPARRGRPGPAVRSSSSVAPGLGVGRRPAATPRPRPAPRARGCRRAGRPSTTRARRRSARATRSVWFISRCQLLRGVPVVADVVVVEDHRARQGRQQPPVQRVGPRQPVQVGVLLEVLELLAGRLVEAAPRGDVLPHLLAGLVGVHLVAEEAHEVRPVAPPRAPAGSGGGRRPAGRRRRCWRCPRRRAGTLVRQEPKASRVGSLCRRVRIRLGGRSGVLRLGLRPDLLVVDVDRVVAGRARLQAVEDDQGVVPPVRAEGRRRPLAVEGPHPHHRRRRGSGPRWWPTVSPM